MSDLSIPLQFGGVNLPALNAGQPSPQTSLAFSSTESYYLPDPSSRPHSPIAITRLYLPICAYAVGATSDGTATPPANVQLQLLLVQAGRIFWAWSEMLPMIQDPQSTSISSVNYTVSEDLVNAIRIDPEDAPILQVITTYDQDSTGSNFYAGATIPNPAAPGIAAQPNTGTAFYTIPTT